VKGEENELEEEGFGGKTSSTSATVLQLKEPGVRPHRREKLGAVMVM